MSSVALAALLGLRAMGILAQVPVALLVGTTAGTLVVTSALTNWKRARRLPLWVRLGLEVIGIAGVIYETGWGPVLSVGFVFCTAQAVAIEGSPAVFPATLWSLICLAAAETTVGFGWTPSVLSAGRSHGIAVLMGAGLVFVNRIIWLSAHEREVASDALVRSEERFRRLLLNAADAVVVLDRTGMIVFATEAIELLTGYAVDELVGRRDAGVIVQPEDVARIRNTRREDGEPTAVREDIRVHHRDGSLRWCQITLTNQLDDPVIQGVVVNVHDITERKKAAASIASAEARFRTLVQHAADGIIVVDVDARCQYVSPSYERLTGIAASRLVGKVVRQFVKPEDTPVIGAAWAQMLQDPTVTTCALVRVQHADGTWRWQETSISNRLADPTIAGIVLNVRDVTDRKALDDLLAEESRILEMIVLGRTARDRPRPRRDPDRGVHGREVLPDPAARRRQPTARGRARFSRSDVREGRVHRGRRAAVVGTGGKCARRGAHRLRRARPGDRASGCRRRERDEDQLVGPDRAPQSRRSRGHDHAALRHREHRSRNAAVP